MDFIKKAIIDYTVALKLLKGRKLWVLLILPALISLVLGSIFLYIAYVSGTMIADFFTDLYPFEFGKKAADTFFHLVPFTYIIAIMLLKYVIFIAISPFMSLLSKHIEHKYKPGAIDHYNAKENLFLRTLRTAGRSFYKEILWTILFCAVGIIIPVAGLVGFIITQSYYIGVMHLDYTLDRKLVFRDMLNWIDKNRGLALGNGFVYITLIFIPFIGILIAPILATAAASISALDQLEN